MQINRVQPIAFILAIFLLSFISGPGLAQEQPNSGMLNGTVSNVVGDPLTGIEVSVYANTGGSWVLQAYTETDSAGAYSFPNLPANIYRLKYFDWGQVYAYEFYEDAASIDTATDIVITDGQTLTIDVALEIGGKITGTLTGPSGSPVQYGNVFLYESSAIQGNVLYIASKNGNQYTFGGLPSGDYVVRFTGQVGGQNYGEYYQDRYEFAEADPVSVTTGFTTSGINGVIGDDTGGAISGLVAGQSGSPLAGIQVVLYRLTAADWQVQEVTNTGADGLYTFDSLPSDTYRLGFTDYSGDYAYEYYPDAGTVAQGADILVANAPISMPVVVLDPAGRITGALTDPAGNPLENPLVFVFEAGGDGGTPLFLTGAANGTYEIGGLRTGDYILRYNGMQGPNAYQEFYDNAPDFQSANPVPVITGTATAGIDSVMGLTPGGTIEGAITDVYGYSFDFAKVQAYEYDGQDWVFVAEEQTDYTSADYSINLPPGAYRLRFEAGSYFTPGYTVEEYYDDVTVIEAGVDVPVVFGETTGSVDAALGNFADGTISGVVLDEAAGTPLEGMQVYLYDQRFRPLYNQAVMTAPDGSYTLSDIWPGQYYVEVFDPAYGYRAEYYGGSSLPGGAQPVVVSDVGVTGIDVQLNAAAPGTLPGSVGGTLTDEQGQPVTGIRVAVYDAFGDFSANATSDMTGSYLARGLADGDYRVQFTAPDGGYVSEWYDNVPDEASAVTVTVSSSATTSGIDAELALAGGISGTVTDPFGNPYPITGVTAFQFDGQSWVQVKSTAGLNQAEYSLTGLLPGTYRVGFYGTSWSGGNGQSEFYDDVQAIEAGTDIVVIGGEIVTGIEAVLGQGPGGSISGTVTDADGNPASGIEVILYEEDFFPEGAAATTDAAGSFTFPLLFNGIYFVEFSDPAGVLPGEFYLDAPSLNFATPVSVSGAPVTGVDAVLDGANGGAGGGSITGQVISDADGATLPGIQVDCYDATGGFISGCRSTTQPDGTYFLGGFLPAGDYLVRFSDPAGNYVYEYYDDALQFAEAMTVTVSLGTTTENVDAGLEPAGAISGTVTDAEGDPYDIAVVGAFSFNGTGWEFVRSTVISEETAYTLAGLPGGTYRIRFSGSSFSGIGNPEIEYFDGAAAIEDGTDVPVIAGQTTSGIDAAIGSQVLGGMGGTVTALDGTPLSGVQIRLLDDLGFLVEQTLSDPDGTWAFTALAPEPYYVQFSDPAGMYVSEFYDDAPDFSGASPVNVQSGVTTVNVDAALEAFGGVSGTVRDLSGQPLDFVQLVLYTFDGAAWVPSESAYTDPAGGYSFASILPDTYRLEITGYRLQPFTMFREYYENAVDLSGADDILLNSGESLVIDVVLGDVSAPEGAILGQVLDSASQPLESILVTLYWQDRSGLWWQAANLLTGPDGSYRIEEILGSRYRICFSDPSGEYESECFDDADHMGAAQDIDVPPGGLVNEIDAVLEPQPLSYRIFLPTTIR